MNGPILRRTISPIKKAIGPTFDLQTDASARAAADAKIAEKIETYQSLEDVDRRVKVLEKEMRAAAKDLDFEKAAELRDRIRSLKELVVL